MTSDDEAVFLRRLGARMRLYRRARRWSQAELASRIGTHRVVLGAMERGRRGANVLVLWRVASALGLSLSELVDVDGPLPYGLGPRGAANRSGT